MEKQFHFANIVAVEQTDRQGRTFKPWITFRGFGVRVTSIIFAVALVTLQFGIVRSAHALSIYLSESSFLNAAPIVSTETFDEFPSDTRIAETTGVGFLCEVEALVDDVIYFHLDDESRGSCWWGVGGNVSDGPPPVSLPNLFFSSGIASPESSDSEELISFGSRRFVKAIGFFFHSAISADFINANHPDFLGWQIFVTEMNGEMTTINTDAYLGAGPTPPYFGFLSESGIKNIKIQDAPGNGTGNNWGYDNVSRSEIMLAETVDNVTREAEAYDASITGTGACSGAIWRQVDDPRASNGAAMQASGNIPRCDTPEDGARLEYDIDFPIAGNYYVCLRGRASGFGSDSVWFGLDDNFSSNSINGYQPFSDYVHTNDARQAIINVPSAGTHRFMLATRERNNMVDKFHITPSPDCPPSN